MEFEITSFIESTYINFSPLRYLGFISCISFLLYELKILSSYNKKDIQEINPKYLKGLKFIYVDSMKDVISNSIINRKVTNPKLI